jgi:hypothetical protein
VQQDGGLADDPALVAGERDRLEAVVEALVARGGDVARRPRAAAVGRLEQRLARAEQEAFWLGFVWACVLVLRLKGGHDKRTRATV